MLINNHYNLLYIVGCIQFCKMHFQIMIMNIIMKGKKIISLEFSSIKNVYRSVWFV
jgi:hypothetical protein